MDGRAFASPKGLRPRRRDKPGPDEENRCPPTGRCTPGSRKTPSTSATCRCAACWSRDAHYPWLLLVPRRAHAVEIIDLDEVAQAQLMTEIARVARALKEVTRCDKLNIAALGNLVPQLHVHVIARRTGDAAWPRPVWGVMPPLSHDAEEVQTFISALRRKIWLG